MALCPAPRVSQKGGDTLVPSTAAAEGIECEERHVHRVLLLCTSQTLHARSLHGAHSKPDNTYNVRGTGEG